MPFVDMSSALVTPGTSDLEQVAASKDDQTTKAAEGESAGTDSQNEVTDVSRRPGSRGKAVVKPAPLSLGKTTTLPLRSAPLLKPDANDHEPSPLRKSQSVSSSPTRLETPSAGEKRRSSDTLQGPSKRRNSRDNGSSSKRTNSATRKPISRSSSLKRAALGRTPGLATIASLIQSPSLEALIKGRRRPRKLSDSSKSKGRASSVPASPSRSRSRSPPETETTPNKVVFQKPQWSPAPKSSNSPNVASSRAQAPSKADSKTLTLSNDTKEQTQETTRSRSISFGTLPQREATKNEESPKPTDAQNKTTGPSEGKRISFASLPTRPPVDNTKPIVESKLEEDVPAADAEASDDEAQDQSSAENLLKPDDARVGKASPRGLSPSPRRVRAIPRPTFTVTAPIEERIPTRKIEVHPNTNYSRRASAEESSSSESESEDMNDIRKAQKLSINQSVIDNSIKHRSIRTIIRGNFSDIQAEAEQGLRRLRTYLVATDASGEAAYALEWTIGTVLRDGDTLIAVYAVDQELGTGAFPDPEAVPAVPVGEGAAAMQDTQDTIGKQSDPTKAALKPQVSTPGRKGSAIPRDFKRAQQERIHAIEEISKTCIKFLRKTKLQVRIGVEVVYCESPKHMITEAIDELEPTMCIVGSRGQSSMKGVLLGSFSNYLVMKSSAPVMVARKKLRAASQAPKVRLSNNLTPNRRPLSEARID